MSGSVRARHVGVPGIAAFAAAIALAVSFALAGAAASSDLLPFEPGDRVEYASSEGAMGTAEVDLAAPGWLHVSDLAGLGPMWIATRGDALYYWQPRRGRAALLADLGAPVGARFPADLGRCNRGGAVLGARDETVTTPAGVFRDALRLDLDPSCPAAGVERVWLAPGAGPVRFDQRAEGGTVRHVLVSGRIGGREIPEPARLRIESSFPGPAVDASHVLGWRLALCGDEAALPECDAPAPTVPVRLVAHNQGGETFRWQSLSAQLFEIALYDELGVRVSRWSRGRSFEPGVHDRELPPGESLSVGGEIELTDGEGGPLPPGHYTLVIEVLGSVISATAPLDIEGPGLEEAGGEGSS